jgi:hypothetical protein
MVRELLTKLFNRRAAYRSAFMDGNSLSEHGRRVINDLAKFCRANDTTTQVSPITRTVDPLASAQAEGRREVFLRIMWHLKLTESDMISLKQLDDD